jgi:hypothetical protein
VGRCVQNRAAAVSWPHNKRPHDARFEIKLPPERRAPVGRVGERDRDQRDVPPLSPPDTQRRPAQHRSPGALTCAKLRALCAGNRHPYCTERLDGRLAPRQTAWPFSLPLLRNPQSCDRCHTTARRRAVRGGPRRRYISPRPVWPATLREGAGAPGHTLTIAPILLPCLAVFAGRAWWRGWLVPQQLRQLSDVGGDAPGSRPWSAGRSQSVRRNH